MLATMTTFAPSGLTSPPKTSGRVLQNVASGRCLSNLPSGGSCAPYTFGARVAAQSLVPFHTVTPGATYPLIESLVGTIPGTVDASVCVQHPPGSLGVSIVGCVEYNSSPLSLVQQVGPDYLTFPEQDVPGTPADESKNGCLADQAGAWVTVPAASCDAIPEAHWIWID
jgi:hypothetical protein